MLLALDVGDKRIGVALSDKGELLASPHAVYTRSGGQAEERILKLINELGIKRVIVGIPLNAAGERTLQCEKVEAFCRRLCKRCNIEITYVDEFLSSVEAQERLNSSGKRRKLKTLDSAAAAIILQTFLDSR